MEVSIEADDSLRGSMSTFRNVMASLKERGLAKQDEAQQQAPTTGPPPPPRRLVDGLVETTQQQLPDAIPKSVMMSSKKGGTGSGPPLSASTEFGSLYPSNKPEKKNTDKPEKERFLGLNVLEYALWAHYLSYCTAFVCFICGIFALAWDGASTSFSCSIDGKPIASKYLAHPGSSNANANSTTIDAAQCNTSYYSIVDQKIQVADVCCHGEVRGSITGDTPMGSLFMIYSVLILAFEDTNIGLGLYYPNDSISYEYRFSGAGLLHALVGLAGLSSYTTALAGVCLLACCAVMQFAAWRGEAGDGGRGVRQEARLKAFLKEQKEGAGTSGEMETQPPSGGVLRGVTASLGLLRDALGDYLPSMRCKLVDPRVFLLRIYNEDKLSSYVWATVFAVANLALFSSTWAHWQKSVDDSRAALLAGTLDVLCDSSDCAFHRQLVKSGPMSNWAPLAKACGACLNLDCSLLILPVIKMLIRKLNNAGESLAAAQNSTDYFRKLFARPITRYVPLQKNIEFHKVCAYTVLFFSIGHIIAHLANLRYADASTLVYFTKWGWQGTDYFTGAAVTFALVVILSASSNLIRHTKFEIFFNAHHMFVVFYLFMFMHGPNFIYWSILPVTLYVIERYLQVWRGNQQFLVTKVEWIAPVMSVYFRPVLPNSFTFKEGQYLYLNCPFISKSEWHPFTISSAMEDMSGGPRVSLATGEEVVPVPRPADLAPGAKWNYFYPVSRDWREMTREEYLEKGETDYHDYISVHIRVHGLEDAEAKSWTRRLKEYFELIAAAAGHKKFPFFFTRREPRGDVFMGRLLGPDGTQMLRVDGPHSAPSEHYVNYGTVMLIGAGIGLTPCASILSALAKYRWKRNFSPEILHFYWMVRQSEIDSYQWFIHTLTELSFEVKRARETKQIDPRYYLEINVYVTGTEKGKVEPKPFCRAKRPLGSDDGTGPQPHFQAEELYEALLNPDVASKDQVKVVKGLSRFSVPGPANEAPNRLQDIFVWNGRPAWDSIFAEIRESRQTADIGVCFCGAAAIGSDLQTLCQKYSSTKDECYFTLHKENF